MGTTTKSAIIKYTRILKEAGIYDGRLTPQIKQAAATEMIVDKLIKKIEESEDDIDCALLSQVAKFQSIHLNQLRAIGMNYDAAPNKIQDAPNVKNVASKSKLTSILNTDEEIEFKKKKK